MRFQPGVRLGPYEITGPIGAGGMGEVYRARDSRLGREVAIKVLPQDLAGDRERLVRFEREARSSSALNHRNIVTIHDFSSQDGEAWLVMELIQGESLRALASPGRLPMKRLLPIASGVAEGLAAAHAAGIVHRDLKPENIMVTIDGTPKILDFGLVKEAAVNRSQDDSTALKVSMTGTVMGTAGYMSPEQGRGEQVDFRSDQFAFGLILHEMASGRHPFRRATAVETLAAIMNDEPAHLGAEFPQSFAWIVERCLEKNPADRYGSTSDLAHDLSRLRAGSDQQTNPSTSMSKRKWPAIAIVTSVLAAFIFLAAIAFFKPRGNVTAAVDPTYSAVYTPDMAEIHLGEVVVPLALSPNGRYLAIYGRDVSGTKQLSLHDLRNGTTRQLAENGYNAAWSPDSRQIAFFADGKLKTIPAEGGPARTVCAANPQGPPSWHGDTILFSQYLTDPGIYRVDAGGGTPQLLYDAEKNPIAIWPHFLPDGKRFIYLTKIFGSGTDEIRHELRVASLDKSSDQLVATIDSRAVYANGQLLFVRDGTLMAQPFDPDDARTIGQAKAIIEGIHYFRSTGNAAFAVADNGLIAWRSPMRPVRLVWMDPSGRELSEVARAAFHADGRLSPDETRYAVSIVDPKQGSADLWAWNLERKSSQRLTFRLLDDRMPVWSPDGRTIYYSSDGKGPPDIFRLAPGAQSGELLYSGPSVDYPHDVSPDAQSLLFITYSLSGTDIAVLPLTPPGTPQPFLSTPFSESAPRFSPDGRWVSYVSNISGQPEIYVRPFDGPTPEVRISTEGGTTARWRKDGGELYYLAPGGRIMAAPMKEGVPTGSPRMLFQAERAVDFEVAANGTKFLMQLNERSGAAEVQLLSNWTARLAHD